MLFVTEMKLFTILSMCSQFVSATTWPLCLRVVGGSVTNIAEYPSTCAILHSNGLYFDQICGGVIVNERHVLTVAHCCMPNLPKNGEINVDPKSHRVRVGSSAAHINGYTYDIIEIIIHPQWNRDTYDNDVAIMVTDSTILYSVTVQPAVLADTRYNLPDNEPVWAVGWGLTEKGQPSERLRHVQVWTINHRKCQELYKLNYKITDNMLCSGWLEVGGRDHCTRDSGSPVYHYGTVVGISSLGLGCGLPQYPGINVRISRYSSWIKSNVEGKIEPAENLKNGESVPSEIKLDIRITLELGSALKLVLKSIACASKLLNQYDSSDG